MHAIALLSIAITLSGCTSRIIGPLSLPLVDSTEAVSRFEGKKVRLVGQVSNSKIPEIHGVDVTSDDPDLRGEQAEAYGILRRFVVSDSQVRAMDEAMVAHRGSGIYWVLEDPKTKAPAQVQRPPIIAPITIPAR